MEPTEQEVAEVQMDDVLPEISGLQKSTDDIKGDITQLFDRLSDLGEDIDNITEALKKHGILPGG
jgi:peptidoglycan hydrolase CwlO-like protein